MYLFIVLWTYLYENIQKCVKLITFTEKEKIIFNQWLNSDLERSLYFGITILAASLAGCIAVNLFFFFLSGLNYFLFSQSCRLLVKAVGFGKRLGGQDFGP